VPVTLTGRRSARVVAQVERAAASGGSALARAVRTGQLERLAATDHLTMIANRRSFTASLERELARSVRSGKPVSLVMLDLDDFKLVNDVYGHPAGDEALRNVAAALSIACRDLDTPARYGGEEFTVILPDCDEQGCLAIAERLRAAVAAAPAARPLTASAGVATFPAHAEDGEQLVEAADAALLLAKRAGRNRTVVSGGRPEAVVDAVLRRLLGAGDGGQTRPADDGVR
jgi:diguanylate cyclase (GGDEF)-like protein